MERPTPTNVNGLGERLHALIASQRIRRTLGAAVLVLTFMDVAGLQTKHESSSSIVHEASVETASYSHAGLAAEPRYLSHVIKETIDPTLSKPPKPSKSKIPNTQAARPSISPNCEQYRDEVSAEFPTAPVEDVLFVMFKESECDENAISDTDDHGLMQLHGEPIYDPIKNLRRAYEKYLKPRRGTRPNFSAWYSVCTPGNNPVPKYPGINCL